MNDVITANDLAVLTRWDTPTICNALEDIVLERRGHGFTMRHFFAIDSSLSPVCGFVRTATIRAEEPPGESATQTAAKRMAYYEYVTVGPAPTIVVIQEQDLEPGIGAFWGEVQTTVHKGLGVLGAVNNGSFCDLPDSARGFQLIGGKVWPSYAYVHLVDIDCPVTVYGLFALSNDIVHMDQHGAVMIPPEAVKNIPNTIDLITRREQLIIQAAQVNNFDIEKLKHAIGQTADIH